MVKVIAAHLRKGEKEDFMSLELQGQLEMVQSQTTGRFYATARKCFISSTFDEATAKSFVGMDLPGEIVRIQSDPYDFTIPQTGEIISLTHSYSYVPEMRGTVERKTNLLEMA